MLRSNSSHACDSLKRRSPFLLRLRASTLSHIASLTLPFSVTNIDGGGGWGEAGEEGEVQLENVTLRCFCPNCFSSQFSVSTIFVVYCSLINYKQSVFTERSQKCRVKANNCNNKTPGDSKWRSRILLNAK